MNKFDAIILDIDGTIWNTTQIVADAWNKAIKNLGFNQNQLTAKILQSEFGKTMDTIANDLWPSLTNKEKSSLLKECCNQEHIAILQNTKSISYPKVVETIKKLSSTINFYIVSNCQDGYIELTMQKTGLTPFIKDFECFGRTKKDKAENILLIKNRNNLKNPIYVGDTQGDCDACKKANVPFIFAAYGFGKANSYFAKINSFEELVNFI